MFLDIGKEVAKDYPGIQWDDANIDAMTMWLIKNPFNYDVLVAPNLYGDIVSDLCAQMVGGLGFGCSGNIGKDLGVFEPTHGSAPKYYGQYKVNPIATILSAKMMLDWLGEKDKGQKLEDAVAAVIKEGKVKTYDMGGSDTTLDMAKAIAEKI
jgi:isocitrate/isopropylmalate dehydrogenase